MSKQKKVTSRRGTCPFGCGQVVELDRHTIDGRLVLSCGDEVYEEGNLWTPASPLALVLQEQGLACSVCKGNKGRLGIMEGYEIFFICKACDGTGLEEFADLKKAGKLSYPSYA